MMVMVMTKRAVVSDTDCTPHTTDNGNDAGMSNGGLKLQFNGSENNL